MRWLHALIAVVLTGLMSACSLASEPAKPPLWKVSDGDTTVWLLGSMHLLPPGAEWRDAAVERAIGQADTLVVESDPGATAGFDAIAKAPGLPPLSERVPPERRDALGKAIARTGQPADAFDGYKDWAAAVMLARPSISRVPAPVLVVPVPNVRGFPFCTVTKAPVPME